MIRSSAFGVAIALGGVLFLTPDALLMRLSEMDGAQMIGWRGLLSGCVFVAIWLISARGRLRAELRGLFTAAGATVVACHTMNAILFSTGIAIAPVSVVLFGVATVPVFSAVFSHLLLGERAGRGTWTATALVMVGIAIAVFGDGPDLGAGGWPVLLGALGGLGVAMALGMTFVTLRRHRDVPLPLAIGLGAFIAGILGTLHTGPERMTDGAVWAIAATGLAILPISFYALSLASRYTAAATVSLIMLLETVLAPFWVWYGIGEAPTTAMMIGGAIVVVTLGVYLGRKR